MKGISTLLVFIGLLVALPADARIVRKVGRDGVLTYVFVPDRPKHKRRGRRRAPVRRYRDLLAQAARKYRLPVTFLEAVLRVESNGNRQAVSAAGAQGLMQLIPKTQKRLGVVDPFDARENIFAGAKYLRELADRFDHNLVLMISGYHAGERAVVRAGYRVPSFPSTRRYVAMVLRRYYRLRNRSRKRRAPPGGKK